MNQGYREDDGLILESDADEQLLIYIPFTQIIKLHSIVIKGPEEEAHRHFETSQNMVSRTPDKSLSVPIAYSSRVVLGPKTVKLYSNKEHMGFSNVNDFPPSDTAVLSTENLKVTAVWKPSSFEVCQIPKCSKLTIFIEDNQSESELTKVQKIALYGSTVETTDMKGLKKIEDQH
ncbi:hypothetical protein RDABS01_030915 [Bienertia sinuspersici]